MISGKTTTRRLGGGKKCQCGTRGVDVKNVVMVACTVIFTKEIIKEESIRVTLLEQKYPSILA